MEHAKKLNGINEKLKDMCPDVNTGRNMDLTLIKHVTPTFIFSPTNKYA